MQNEIEKSTVVCYDWVTSFLQELNMTTKLEYNQDWNEHFEVDEKSPSGIMRIKDKNLKNFEGWRVGYKHFESNGNPRAWGLKFQERLYVVHRIIWVLTYGSIDSALVIDHLDGDPFNNKINNLSLKTTAGNMKNQRKYSNNTTGITGVKLTDAGGGMFYYTAQWYELNKYQKKKHFSIQKLGWEEAKTLATAYREEQIQRLILEGAEYTERHGL